MKIGSLFSGYGGLDMAVETVFPGARPAWFCEFDPAPARILEAHWPDVPNLRDVTTVDWSQVEPVDILTGGTPCQDLSAAGKRAGMTEGTRSNLWVNMRESIVHLRPRIVVWENVQGALSASATSDSDLEPGSGLLGNGGGGYLRALGRVLGDLAEVGYDARWATVRASDIGAPHHRGRVFLVATPADAKGGSGRFWDGNDVRAGRGEGQQQPGARRGGTADTGGAAVGQFAGGPSAEEARPVDGDGFGHPVGKRPSRNGREGIADPYGVRGEDRRHGSGACPQLARPGGGDLPLPDASDDGCEWGGQARHGRAGSEDGCNRGVEWGAYAPAVRRWERLTRPAPAPTEPNTKGKPRLNAAFAEWMMGLPAGHVTGVDLPRSAQLKAIGNGVCPPQAVAALRALLATEVSA